MEISADMPDLWTQGYRAYSATVYLNDDTPSAQDSFNVEQLDLAPDFPVLKAFLRSWLDSGRAGIKHVEVSPCEDVDRSTLEAHSISTLVH